jgi:EF-hand domain pair
LDSEANKARIISDQFKDAKGSLVLSKTYSAFEDRVTEKEWIAAVNAAFKETGIPKRNLTAIPMKSDCMSDKFCPTQADWCLRDPTCSVSPYQEPSASMKSGATAGFVIGGIAVLLTAFYFIHKYLSSQQIKRYKTIFAKRIAETIQVNKSIRSMEPEELAEEFKRVDLQTDDGLITKDDLWEFISSGKAGEITQSDFNALFAAIDADGDGQVDFLAFCAFMGQWYVTSLSSS